MHVRRFDLLCAIALCIAVGCSDGNQRPIKAVTVTVIYKGAPVPDAVITFVSDEPDAPAAFGKTDESGVAKPQTPEIG
jgi:hypothetical protein